MEMISRKIKFFLTAFFFIAFLFLLIGSAKAVCYDFCSQTLDCDCGRQGTLGLIAPVSGSACLIGTEGFLGSTDLRTAWCGYGTTDGYVVECTNAGNTRECKSDACPAESGKNGENCLVSTACGWVCDWMQDCYGKWDASEKACVRCLGMKKTYVFGSSSKIYITCIDNNDHVCATNGFDVPDTFETACDSSVDTRCDDKLENDPCAAEGTCDANGQCVGGGSCGNGLCTGTETCASCAADCGPCGGGGCASGPSYTCPTGVSCPSGTCPVELQGGLVPCGRTCDDPCTAECECAPCTLCHLFVLLKRIIDFVTIDIVFPLAVLMLVIGGVMYLTSAGDPGKIGGAKKILTATAIGILIILVSWLIVDTVIMFLTPAGSPLQAWNTIDCSLCGDGNCSPDETAASCPADCEAACSARGVACTGNLDCCSSECSLMCYDSSLSGTAGDQCYHNSECLSNSCLGPYWPGAPGHCE